MRVYKLKLAFEGFFFFFWFVLFEVAAEQVPLRKIREITLYRADVFFFFFFFSPSFFFFHTRSQGIVFGTP